MSLAKHFDSRLNLQVFIFLLADPLCAGTICQQMKSANWEKKKSPGFRIYVVEAKMFYERGCIASTAYISLSAPGVFGTTGTPVEVPLV